MTLDTFSWIALALSMIFAGFVFGPHIAGIISIIIGMMMVAIVVTMSMSVVFWIVIGSILMIVLVKSTFEHSPTEDDRIIDRSNVKQQSNIQRSTKEN